MPFLELKNIGKIYASDGAVAIGIRGVDLAFERGEFVAVTGESGSGKSTLLNVISGMDTYEEGELLIEGQPTSHYLQSDWEDYRHRYISFVFQDYNIIDSFTVLQNVELSLMHIRSAVERRRRAMELLDRVGLSGHLRQKGSRLSGGQKQRTVIARALAKDSPVILADEPTGNLDAASSREIMALLHEISKDKLVIVVTHSFDETEQYATRHIRIYDGSVASDTVLTSHDNVSKEIPPEMKQSAVGVLSNGCSLGWAIFRSKPLLSLFICFLLLVGTIAVIGISSASTSALELFERRYVFTPADGRLVVARRDGAPFSGEEISGLAEESGAEGIVRYDAAYDFSFDLMTDPDDYAFGYSLFNCVVKKCVRPGRLSAGRYPEKVDEILVCVPVSAAQDELSVKSFEPFTAYLLGREFHVVGIKTFRDNRRQPEIICTDEGFDYISACHCAANFLDIKSVILQGEKETLLSSVIPLSTLSGDEVYFSGSARADTSASFTVNITCSATFVSNHVNMKKSSDGLYRDLGIGCREDEIYISIEKYVALFEQAVSDETGGYPQISLFFGSDRAARSAARKITGETYVAVSSDTEREMSLLELVSALISGFFSAVMWVLGVIFIAFFINLCTSKTIDAFRGEMAVMRSMGIPVKVIRTGMFFRMLISAVPAIIITLFAAFVIYDVPKLSAAFDFVPPAVFALVIAGVLIIVIRVTAKQVKKLFGESVKKAIRGGK